MGCGACCAIEPPSCTAAEAERLPAWYVSEGSTARSMTQEVGRCVALRGTPGSAVACLVYEVRPRCCREVEAGSPACLDARRRVGLEGAA
jgi:Fe-S-cluster containining protein